MATVDSVQTVSIALDDTETTDSTTLAALTLANAVPFATHKSGAFTSNWFKIQNDIELASGADRVVVTRGAASGNHDTSAAVVEFGTGVTIQSGSFDIDSGNTTDTVAITTVTDSSNAFLVFYMLGDQVDGDRAITRGYFSSTTELTFERGSSTGAVTGHWFVIEAADGAEFDVQSWSIDMASSTSNTATLTTLEMADTMVVSSFHTESVSRAPDEQGIRVRLSGSGGDEVTADRYTSNASVNTVSGFSVEFSGAEDVQRGVHTWSATEDDQTTSITEVTASLAMAWNPHPHAGVSESVASSSPTHTVAITTLDDTTTVRQSGTLDGAETAITNWEVIEWELVAGLAPGAFLKSPINPLLRM